MAMSRLEMAFDEIERIAEEIPAGETLGAALSSLEDAIKYFGHAQREAADKYGFEVRRSMKT